MSALPPKAEVQHGRDVRFVPKADILHCGKCFQLWRVLPIVLKPVRKIGRITNGLTSGSARNAHSCQNYPSAFRGR